MGLNRVALGKRALSEYSGQRLPLNAIKKLLVVGGCSADVKTLESYLRALDLAGVLVEVEPFIFEIKI